MNQKRREGNLFHDQGQRLRLFAKPGFYLVRLLDQSENTAIIIEQSFYSITNSDQNTDLFSFNNYKSNILVYFMCYIVTNLNSHS